VAALVTLCSAKGSPGVTTTALSLAYAWPRPVLIVEADVTAGSTILAGHLNGRTPHERGLLGLGLAHRRHGRLVAEDVWTQTIGLAEGRFLLPGLGDPVQAAQMTAAWAALGEVLRELPDVDVVVDFGRLGSAFDAAPLLTASDSIIVLARCTLVDAYALTRRLPVLTSLHGPEAVSLMTIGPKDPYAPAELARKLAVPLLAEMPWDPGTAAFLSHGRQPSRRRSAAPLTTASTAAAVTILKDRSRLTFGQGGIT
jgi:cellulose biosynthesis protein BcsQ